MLTIRVYIGIEDKLIVWQSWWDGAFSPHINLLNVKTPT